MPLSNVQIYDIARAAGFPPDVAVQMVAIALRESGGNPSAVNLTPPDESYGLWQINMYGSLKASRLALFGLSDPSQLLDPDTNARAAFALYGGNPANLNVAWAINNYGPPYFYGEKYLLNLPAGELARAQSNFDAPVVASSGAPTGGGGDTSIGTDAGPPDDASVFQAGLVAQIQSHRPSPGGVNNRRVPKWLSAWFWGLRSTKLPLDRRLTDAMAAMITVYGRHAVLQAIAQYPTQPPPHGDT